MKLTSVSLLALLIHVYALHGRKLKHGGSATAQVHKWRGLRSQTTTLPRTNSTSERTPLNAAIVSIGDAEPVKIFRAEYEPLPFTVDTLNMDFNISDGLTTVTTEMTLVRNPAVPDMRTNELVLDGDETSVKLFELSMDGKNLVEGADYELAPGTLTLKNPGTVIRTVVEIVPENNTSLAGLYKSGDMYLTQNGPIGFRRITYYPDRPDNMAVFERVRIEAASSQYPVLLSNGHLIEEGFDESGSRKYTVWSDPVRKPSYLFAIVAGNLESIQDTYTTKSGRNVQIEIFSEAADIHKLDFAMQSLIKAMKWDEEQYGLEYDLDVYNVVATESLTFNAMENKGLNIFKSIRLFADATTSTDAEFQFIESLIGHEYFHNWSGNRVTIRDWFQLTLKEGVTTFREQQFASDMNSHTVQRIKDVQYLRSEQFPEDKGSKVQPVRPESYLSAANLFTRTVYYKGAEVVRMLQTILTWPRFRKGMDLFFLRHDGSAATIDELLEAMEDANGVDLTQFSRWYSTPGTPIVKYSYFFHDGTFTLELSQSSRSDEPLHIPVSVGLLNKTTVEEVVPTQVLELKNNTQTFTFEGLQGDVVPSILRDFSAPVKLVPASGIEDEEALAFLSTFDTDGFNRWEAGQRLFGSLIFQALEGAVNETTLGYAEELFERLLDQQDIPDFAIQAYALTLPSVETLVEEMLVLDPVGLRQARDRVMKMLAQKYQVKLMAQYSELTESMEADGGVFKVDAASMGKRQLRNVLLDYLTSLQEAEQQRIVARELAMNHFQTASGMTDKMAALSILSSMSGTAESDEALQTFYDEADGDALLLDKWFSVQALANLPDVLERVKALTEHSDFTISNPDRVRALLLSFTRNTASSGFHALSGDGYRFLAEQIVLVDPVDSHVSRQLIDPFLQWRRYDRQRGLLMKAELEQLAALGSNNLLSEGLYDLVRSALNE